MHLDNVQLQVVRVVANQTKVQHGSMKQELKSNGLDLLQLAMVIEYGHLHMASGRHSNNSLSLIHI